MGRRFGNGRVLWTMSRPRSNEHGVWLVRVRVPARTAVPLSYPFDPFRLLGQSRLLRFCPVLLVVCLFAVRAKAQQAPDAAPVFVQEWERALAEFEQASSKLEPGERLPDHPAIRFVDRALALVESGGWRDGEVWILEQLDHLLWPPQRKREIRAELTQQLLGRELAELPKGPAEADSESPDESEPASPSVELLQRLEVGLLELARATFEVPWSDGVGLANEALNTCSAPPVKGAALWALSQYATKAGTTEEEADWIEGDGFLTQVVENFGETRAATLAAPVLCDLMSRRYEAEYKRWWADLEASEAAPDPELHPARQWWPRFEGLSDRGVGVALWWLIRNADVHTGSDEERRELRLRLFDRIVEEHADALWLVDAIPEADTMVDELSRDAVLNLGIRLLDVSSRPEVRAIALYEMAGLASRDEADDEGVELALDFLRQLVKEQPRHQLARAAGARIYELENLRVGSLAPEILISEKEGGPFRLSDYRGRVTLIVFWGYGFGGDRGLLKTLEPYSSSIPGARFAVLGVNTDDRGPDLEERLREDAFGWDHVLVGGPSAHWPATWGVNRFPTTFLLDEEGVILAKHLKGRKLAQAVQAALTPAEEGSSDEQ